MGRIQRRSRDYSQGTPLISPWEDLFLSLSLDVIRLNQIVFEVNFHLEILLLLFIEQEVE